MSVSVDGCSTVRLILEEVDHSEHKELDIPTSIQVGRNTTTGPGVGDDSDGDCKDKDDDDDDESSSFSESSDDESERTERSR